MPFSFVTDEKLDEVLEQLRTHYKLTSKAEVLQKAVTLLHVAKDYCEADNSIVFIKNNHHLKVLL